MNSDFDSQSPEALSAYQGLECWHMLGYLLNQEIFALLVLLCDLSCCYRWQLECIAFPYLLLLNPPEGSRSSLVWTCRISTNLTWSHLGSPMSPLTSNRPNVVVCVHHLHKSIDCHRLWYKIYQVLVFLSGQMPLDFYDHFGGWLLVVFSHVTWCPPSLLRASL